jgi:hypothetical protein
MANEPQFTAEKAGIGPISIKIDQGNGKMIEIDDIESIRNLFSNVNKYNQENSTRAVISNFLFENIKKQAPPTEFSLLTEYDIYSDGAISFGVERMMQKFNSERGSILTGTKELAEALNDSLDVQKIIQSNSANGISIFYQSLAIKLGLSIELTNDNERLTLSNENYFEGKQIRFNISDTQRFLSFLNNLNPETLDDNFKDALESLMKNLSSQLADHFIVSTNMSAVKFMNHIETITEQCKRLNLNKVAINLEKYSDYLKVGILKEFLMLENKGCLVDEKNNYNNPSIWQKIYEPDFFEQKWDYVLDILNNIAHKPQASKYFLKLNDYFLSCAETSLSRVENPDFTPKDGKDGYIKNLNRIIKQLKALR